MVVCCDLTASLSFARIAFRLLGGRKLGKLDFNTKWAGGPLVVNDLREAACEQAWLCIMCFWEPTVKLWAWHCPALSRTIIVTIPVNLLGVDLGVLVGIVGIVRQDGHC